jgi:hypothetical protein
LIDLPGSMSHEYFPHPSRDGRWLVWGASRGGHAPDVSDYDVFLWRSGTPWKEALRITASAANDQWPDVYAEPESLATPDP